MKNLFGVLTPKKQIGVANQNFANLLLANNNPNYMFVREALMNMIEAMLWYLSNGSINFKNPIEMYIRALPLKGFNSEEEFTAPKLSFLNLKGLNADQLEIASSMTGSVDKNQDLDANFGIGIISTVTTFSDLMFITRKDGVAFATVVGFRNGDYVRLLEITEVTDWVDYYAKERGYDRYKNADFTEVLILGHESDSTQNTFECPYSPGNKVGKPNWLIATIFTRFANLPNNIKLIFEGYKVNKRSKNCIVHTINGGEYNYTFRSFQDVVELVKNKQNFRKQTVKLSNGVEIDYIYDGPTDTDKGDARPVSVNHVKTGFDSVFSALEFDGEYFDIYSGLKTKGDGAKEYKHFSGPNNTIVSRIGVIEGSQYFRIILRLPKNGRKMDFSRTSVILKGDNFMEPIQMLDYIDDIYENRPDWFIEKISQHNQNVSQGNFEERVKELLKKFFANDPDVTLNKTVKGKVELDIERKKKPVNPDPKPRPIINTNITVKPNKEGDRNINVSVQIPQVKFVSNNKVLGSDIAEYKISPDTNDCDTIVINENHNIITTFAKEYLNGRDELFERSRIKARDLIAEYLAFSCAIGLVHKNKARSMFSYADFESWVSSPSLNLKAKESRHTVEKDLKQYVQNCIKDANQSAKIRKVDIKECEQIAKQVTNYKGETLVS